ncbi:MAG: YceD family protein [Candidatus Xenobia bacterium]
MEKIDIRDITRAHIGAHMNVSQEVTLPIDGVTLLEPIHVRFKLTNAATRILVEGTLKSRARLECNRCTEPFELPLEVEVHEEFLPEGSKEMPQGPDLSADELDVFVYHEDRIDAEEIIRQNIIAALPMMALCQEACRGLCPMCGANRNQAPCSCEEQKTDPRWAGLEKFRGQN